MDLSTKLTLLCSDLSMLLPYPNKNGVYHLHFDASISFRIFTDKSTNVVLSLLAAKQSLNCTDCVWIENAMNITYSWQGFSTSLILDSNENIQLQTLIAATSDYNEFYDLFNAHCSLHEQLIQELNTPKSEVVSHHVFITP